MTESSDQKKKTKKSDPFSGITGGLILILLGVLFLLVTHGYLSWLDWWAYFLVGLGVILILEVVIRSFFPAYRQQGTGKIIGGTILIIIGATNIYGFFTWWPLVIIALGLFLIYISIQRSRKSG